MKEHTRHEREYYDKHYSDWSTGTEQEFDEDIRLASYGVHKLANWVPKNVSLCILDVGGGDGVLTSSLVKYVNRDRAEKPVARATVIDVSRQGLKSAQKRALGVIVGSVTELPIKSNSVDMVCAFHVLEHIEFDDLAILEISRVLKVSGICYVVTPNKLKKLYWPLIPNNLVALCILKDHVRSGYEAEELKAKFGVFGSEMLEVGYYGFLGAFFEFLIIVPIFAFLRLIKASPDQRRRLVGLIYRSVISKFKKLDRFFSENNPHGSGVYAFFRKVKQISDKQT